MNKREAKIEALRIAGALIYTGVKFDPEEAMIQEQMELIANALAKRAEKLGGPYHFRTGTSLDPDPSKTNKE